MFSVVIKQLRTKEGLTQEELAKRLGLAKSTISMYENGGLSDLLDKSNKKRPRYLIKDSGVIL